MAHFRLVFYIFLITVLLSACTTTPTIDNAAMQNKYTLQPLTATTSEKFQGFYSIAILKPSIPNSYMGNGIALLFLEKQKTAYYQSTVWASPFPEMLQSFMQESIASLFPFSAEADEHFHLAIQVHRFEPVYKKSLKEIPCLELKMEFTLSANHQVVRNFIVEKKVSSKSSKIDDILHGLEELAQLTAIEAFNSIDHYITARGTP